MWYRVRKLGWANRRRHCIVSADHTQVMLNGGDVRMYVLVEQGELFLGSSTVELSQWGWAVGRGTCYCALTHDMQPRLVRSTSTNESRSDEGQNIVLTSEMPSHVAWLGDGMHMAGNATARRWLHDQSLVVYGGVLCCVPIHLGVQPTVPAARQKGYHTISCVIHAILRLQHHSDTIY